MGLSLKAGFYYFLSTIIAMQKQLRAMLDTNVYDLLLEKGALDRIEGLVLNDELVVYGCKVVRDELRNTPKIRKYGGKSLRALLLSTYDRLVSGKRSYPVGSEIEALAKEYLSAYSGGIPRNKILPDFKIVATATIHRLDIIVSGDDRTMKSGPAKRAYGKVNAEKFYPNPGFIKLEEL